MHIGTIIVPIGGSNQDEIDRCIAELEARAEALFASLGDAADNMQTGVTLVMIGTVFLPGPEDVAFAAFAGANGFKYIGNVLWRVSHSGKKMYRATEAEAKMLKAAYKAENAASAQMKVLSKGEITALKRRGIDPHDLKPNSKYDLFKDKDGNIYVKPKDGSGPGDPTGINVRE